jgi:hypothetical protein
MGGAYFFGEDITELKASYLFALKDYLWLLSSCILVYTLSLMESTPINSLQTLNLHLHSSILQFRIY